MRYRFYTADVFANRIFHGAQIAVFPQAGQLDQRQMQLLAREMNLAETAFVFPMDSDLANWRVRIFSPHAEIDFSGHALIAIGHVLAETGAIPLVHKHTPVTIEENSGRIAVNITQDAGKPVLIQFTRTTRPVLDRFVPPEQQLADMLSLRLTDLENKKFQPLIVYSDHSYLVVPLRTWAAVREAKFDYQAWGQSSAPASMAREIMLLTTQTDSSRSNFHVRLLGPNIGIKEDPPVGSAMPAFSAYLCAQAHIKHGTHVFVVDRGAPTSRQSVLNVEMDHQGEATLTVRIGGPAVSVAEGTIEVPD